MRIYSMCEKYVEQVVRLAQEEHIYLLIPDIGSYKPINYTYYRPTYTHNMRI